MRRWIKIHWENIWSTKIILIKMPFVCSYVEIESGYLCHIWRWQTIISMCQMKVQSGDGWFHIIYGELFIKYRTFKSIYQSIYETFVVPPNSRSLQTYILMAAMWCACLFSLFVCLHTNVNNISVRSILIVVHLWVKKLICAFFFQQAHT